MDKNIENPMIFLMPKVKLPVVKAGSFTYLQDIDLISVEYDFCYAHDPNQKFNTILQGNVFPWKKLTRKANNYVEVQK